MHAKDDAGPETESGSRDEDTAQQQQQEHNGATTGLDERYIRQLKAEIVLLSELSLEKSGKASVSLPHNHHIKNMHSIREQKLVPDTRRESLQMRLARYNSSSDPAQVRFES